MDALNITSSDESFRAPKVPADTLYTTHCPSVEVTVQISGLKDNTFCTLCMCSKIKCFDRLVDFGNSPGQSGSNFLTCPKAAKGPSSHIFFLDELSGPNPFLLTCQAFHKADQPIGKWTLDLISDLNLRFKGDGSNRKFIVEQQGRIQLSFQINSDLIFPIFHDVCLGSTTFC